MARRRTRTKSMNQLADQFNRIYPWAERTNRRDLLDSIFNRYSRNMQRSKQWREAFAKGRDMYFGLNPNATHSEAAAAGFGRADNKQINRSTYMGLSNG